MMKRRDARHGLKRLELADAEKDATRKEKECRKQENSPQRVLGPVATSHSGTNEKLHIRLSSKSCSQTITLVTSSIGPLKWGQNSTAMGKYKQFSQACVLDGPC